MSPAVGSPPGRAPERLWPVFCREPARRLPRTHRSASIWSCLVSIERAKEQLELSERRWENAIREHAQPPPDAGFSRRLRSLADAAARDTLTFLAYREKLLAGSWRFDTYFGRDTLMSVRLLMPVLSPLAVEAALASVLARLSPQGEVAHEEDVGERAVLDATVDAVAAILPAYGVGATWIPEAGNRRDRVVVVPGETTLVVLSARELQRLRADRRTGAGPRDRDRRRLPRIEVPGEPPAREDRDGLRRTA